MLPLSPEESSSFGCSKCTEVSSRLRVRAAKRSVALYVNWLLAPMSCESETTLSTTLLLYLSTDRLRRLGLHWPVVMLLVALLAPAIDGQVVGTKEHWHLPKHVQLQLQTTKHSEEGMKCLLSAKFTDLVKLVRLTLKTREGNCHCGTQRNIASVQNAHASETCRSQWTCDGRRARAVVIRNYWIVNIARTFGWVQIRQRVNTLTRLTLARTWPDCLNAQSQWNADGHSVHLNCSCRRAYSDTAEVRPGLHTNLLLEF